MHFLVQKEVAYRICASNKSGDWGRLGVKIAALFQTSILFDVPPESFDIKPKSSILIYQTNSSELIL